MTDHGGSVSRAADDTLCVQLLGAFRLAVRDRVITEDGWKLRKASSLVKLLALAPHHACHREQLCDLLWPDLYFEAAYNNLRYALHVARRTLVPVLGEPLLVLHRQVIALHSTRPLAIDVEEFEAGVIMARHRRDPASYLEAISRYPGDLLPEDQYEDWATGRREALRETFRTLLAECAFLHEGRGEYPDAIALLRRVIAIEPTDEGAYAGLIRLHARIGQRAQALGFYASLRAMLQRDLDTLPAPATERLYAEVLAGTFASAAPPTMGANAPTATASNPHNLPVSLTKFVGRERECAEVSRLLTTTSLLTLTGTGGCGKSRLALVVAAESVARYRDGVWLVELEGCTDPAVVPQVVAETLGLDEEPGRPRVATLTDALRAKQSLLVLDNCEHLSDACATLVGTLLHAAPGLHVLVTSREALRVPGEMAWRVPSLTLPEAPGNEPATDIEASEAVQLFVDRARWRDPAFTLTGENSAAVAMICRRLDGMPLALELAAARTSVLTPAQLAARLDDALGLLTDGGRTASPRQQTLRATLDWSYALLSDAERATLRRLAVFAGGCTLAAAEAICAGEEIARGAVLDLLAQLADKSLVLVEARSGEARYGLLEIVRQYARERLESSDESVTIQRRHADYYLTIAAQSNDALQGPEQAERLRQIDMEHGNFRAVLRWSLETEQIAEGLRIAAGISRFWHTRGYANEGGRWFATLLARGRSDGTATRDPALWIEALFSVGLLAIDRNDFAVARSVFEEQRAIARTIGDDVHCADALTQLGRIARIKGEYAAARAYATEGLDIRRRLGNARDIAISLQGLGQIALLEGDTARALTLLEEGAAGYRRVGDSYELAYALCILGYLRAERAEIARARALLDESLTLFRGLETRRGIIEALEGFAVLAVMENQPARALRIAAAASSARVSISQGMSRLLRARVTDAIATARRTLGDVEAAAGWATGRSMALDEAIAEALQSA